MKKYFAIILAMLMLFSVVGCGNNTADDANTVVNSNSQTDTGNQDSADDGLDDWPNKTIQIIVPYGAGGDTDINARAYANRLSDVLGVPVVVSNVSGANGATGAIQAAESDPDGYTVLLHDQAMFVSKAFGLMDFGLEAYEPCCIAGKNAGNVLAVRQDSPYQTLDDLIKASQEKEILYGMGIGGSTQVMGLLINQAGGNVKAVDIGGGADRIAALLGDNVDCIPISISSVNEYITSGDFRPLAVMDSVANPYFPEIPTTIEEGYDISFPMYYFFLFPEGTPKAVVDAFADACKEVSEMEDYQKELVDAYGQDTYFMAGDEMVETLLAGEKEVQELANSLK